MKTVRLNLGFKVISESGRVSVEQGPHGWQMASSESDTGFLAEDIEGIAEHVRAQCYLNPHTADCMQRVERIASAANLDACAIARLVPRYPRPAGAHRGGWQAAGGRRDAGG